MFRIENRGVTKMTKMSDISHPDFNKQYKRERNSGIYKSNGKMYPFFGGRRNRRYRTWPEYNNPDVPLSPWSE